MRCSAAYTKRQIAITKGAENVCARRIYGDIGALEPCCAVGSLNALASSRSAMRPSPSRLNSGLHLALRQ